MKAKTKRSGTIKPADTYTADLAELLSGNVYVLIGQRTCKKNGESHHTAGFVWPSRGWVDEPEWNARLECGGGLHFCAVGALGGEVVRDAGSTIITDDIDVRWQVVIARARDCVRIENEKHKARRVFVVDLDGSKEAMRAWLAVRGIVGHHMTATAGDGGTATAGYGGTATAGDGGTATAGDYSRVKTGENGIVVTTWFDQSVTKRVQAWTVGNNRDLKANTLYQIVDGVATEVTQ